MIHFKSILIDRNNEWIKIVADKDDYEVNGVDCLQNVTIDDIIITDDLHYDATFIFPTHPDINDLASKGYFYYALDPQEKIDIADDNIGMMFSLNDIKAVVNGFEFKDRMIFVYIRTNGTVNPASECAYLNVGNDTSMGVSYNDYDLYNFIVHSYINGHLECCDMSDTFILRMLDMKRLALNLQGGYIETAIETWNVIHEGCKTSKTCDCNG